MSCQPGACLAHRSECTEVLFGSGYAGLGQAEHGRVFRVLPRKTPCLQCILQAQADDSQRHPSFKGQETGVAAYRQPGIPGLGMDIDQAAHFADELLTLRADCTIRPSRFPRRCARDQPLESRILSRASSLEGWFEIRSSIRGLHYGCILRRE